MSQVYVVAHFVCDGVYAFLWRCLGFVMIVRLMLCCFFQFDQLKTLLTPGQCIMQLVVSYVVSL